MTEQIKVDRVFEPYLPKEINTEEVETAYREATKDLHPDVGGHPKAFDRLTKSKDKLLGIMEDKKTYQTVLETETTEERTTDYTSDEAGFTVASKEAQKWFNAMDQAEEVVEQERERVEQETDELVNAIGADKELEKMKKVANGEEVYPDW